MKLLLLTFIILGLCVFLLCFNIIFKKDGKFPDTEIEHNKEMRKRGIQCAKMEEKKIWGKKNNRNIRGKNAKGHEGHEGHQTNDCTSDCGSCSAGCE